MIKFGLLTAIAEGRSFERLLEAKNKPERCRL